MFVLRLIVTVCATYPSKYSGFMTECMKTMDKCMYNQEFTNPEPENNVAECYNKYFGDTAEKPFECFLLLRDE